MFSLVECSLTMLDNPLIYAFVKRWHKETYLFHLPFGEMTITINNFYSLSHLPIAGNFSPHTLMSYKIATMIIETYFGFTWGMISEKLSLTWVIIFVSLALRDLCVIGGAFYVRGNHQGKYVASCWMYYCGL